MQKNKPAESDRVQHLRPWLPGLGCLPGEAGLLKRIPILKDFVKPLGPYSHAVVSNGFVFISGQTPLKPSSSSEPMATTVKEQTRQCLRNIETILKNIGSSLNDIVKVTVYLANPTDFAEMNEAYKEFFASVPPARSVARLGAEVPGLLLSIDAIAAYLSQD